MLVTDSTSLIQFDIYRWLSAFILNTILVLIFFRIPLLTKRGWFHAGGLGTILFGTLGLRAWISVLIYLLLGSLVTKLGFKKKAEQGIAESRGGKRGPENVWGSAATGTIIALLTQINFLNKELLLVGFAASFIAKLADTFGSEIGKRWGSKTYLITSFRHVERGTDGGISIEGSIATIIGALVMSLVMVSIGYLPSLTLFLIAFISGITATILESYLGALVQANYMILTNEMVNFLQTTFAAILSILIATLFL